MAVSASFQVRKRADKSEGSRVRMIDPDTDRVKLVNPDTPGEEHEPWPLLGVEPVGALPDEMEISTNFVAKGKAEGWISTEGEEVVHRQGGPAENPWAATNTFVQCAEIVFHFTSGDVRYKVTRQPDKYAAEGTDRTKVTDDMYAEGATRVDRFYRCKIQKGS